MRQNEPNVMMAAKIAWAKTRSIKLAQAVLSIDGIFGSPLPGRLVAGSVSDANS